MKGCGNCFRICTDMPKRKSSYEPTAKTGGSRIRSGVARRRDDYTEGNPEGPTGDRQRIAADPLSVRKRANSRTQTASSSELESDKSRKAASNRSVRSSARSDQDAGSGIIPSRSVKDVVGKLSENTEDAARKVSSRRSPSLGISTGTANPESAASRRPPFIGKLTPVILLPENTRKWIRNATDERAAQEGCRFNQKRAEFAIEWMETNCYLYEGRGAGMPIQFMPWQTDFLFRLYGWVKWSDHWDRWIRRFNQSCLWAPKKSGKSPFEAANGLYLCFAEGEPGMKCYSLAFDKKQALIAHTHAERMVEFSPILSRQCKINRSTHDIFHRASFSTYSVVSGDRHDKKGASKEGFNGSILVDETHAVTFELMRRVKRAGISRPEPLKFECSTAGPDLEGYGFGRFQLGHRIMKSDASNSSPENPYAPYILHEEYMPPQDTTIEEYRDAEKVEKIIIATNPSIAPKDATREEKSKYILSLEEAMDDWREAMATGDQELRDFAMYRTNLWLSSATSWIPMHVWNEAARDYGANPLEQLERLKGYPCFGGLDMSKVGDMSALAVHFLVPLSEDEELSEQINQYNRDRAIRRLKLMGKISKTETALEQSLINRMQTQMNAEAVSLLPEDIENLEEEDSEAFNGKAVDGLSLIHDGVRYIIRSVYFFWIPRKTAITLEGLVNLFKWEHLINFIMEDVINYADVSEHIEWLRTEYGLKLLAYDPNYADDVISNLTNNGEWLERELLQVDQKLGIMSPLSQDWERGIISRSLQHPGNAVLDWMNSHCELYRAASGLVKPVKPPYGSYKKIDGIVAGINGLGCLRHYGIANIINGFQFSTTVSSPPAVNQLQQRDGWTADELGLSETDGT